MTIVTYIDRKGVIRTTYLIFVIFLTRAPLSTLKVDTKKYINSNTDFVTKQRKLNNLLAKAQVMWSVVLELTGVPAVW